MVTFNSRAIAYYLFSRVHLIKKKRAYRAECHRRRLGCTSARAHQKKKTKMLFVRARRSFRAFALFGKRALAIFANHKF